MSCGVGHSYGLDPKLLWLWSRLEATTLIGALAWEPSYATSVALKIKQTNKQKNPSVVLAQKQTQINGIE